MSTVEIIREFLSEHIYCSEISSIFRNPTFYVGIIRDKQYLNYPQNPNTAYIVEQGTISGYDPAFVSVRTNGYGGPYRVFELACDFSFEKLLQIVLTPPFPGAY